MSSGTHAKIAIWRKADKLGPSNRSLTRDIPSSTPRPNPKPPPITRPPSVRFRLKASAVGKLPSTSPVQVLCNTASGLSKICGSTHCNATASCHTPNNPSGNHQDSRRCQP